MADLTPAQRTATTAKILLSVGLLCALEAIWRGSLIRTIVAGSLMAGGAGLLAFARRAG
jgi:hypothetical protein